MKILYLPYNIASMQAVTNQAVNKLEGIQSICFNIGKNKVSSGKEKFGMGKDMIELDNPSKRNIFQFIKWVFLKYYYFFKLIFWADVVHYVWGSFLIADLDLRIIKWLKKPGVIEWVGSDIRSPSKVFQINPYIKSIFYNGYEYKGLEDDRNSTEIQKKFSGVQFEPAVSPELSIYLNSTLFPVKHRLMQRINFSSYNAHYPDPANHRPLIIHSPTAKVAKGSNIIIPTIEELKKEYDFDFLLLHDMSHEEVIQLMKKADIFLDQIIVGSYGTATTEAMSYGKPVMCYIMPEVFNYGLPKECPVINTNPDNLKEQLIKLITSPQLRHEVGIKSRAYAEKYHDADKIATQLVHIYEGVIERRKNKSTIKVPLTA